MERRSFITKLSVLAPAAFVAPNYLFAASGKEDQTESAGLLIIGAAEQNESLRDLISDRQLAAVYLGSEQRILKTERTAAGFRVHMQNRVIDATHVIVDVPVSVDEAAKKIRLGKPGEDSTGNLCFKRRKQVAGFRTLNRSKINAADLDLVMNPGKPALVVLC